MNIVMYVYNSLNKLVRRMKKFVTNKYLTLGPIAIGFSIAILIFITQFRTYNSILYILLGLGIVLFVLGVYFVWLGIDKGKKRDKQVELDRQRIESLMNNLPNEIGKAINSAINKNIIKEAMKEALREDREDRIKSETKGWGETPQN